MRSYEAARTYFSIIGFVAWVVIIIGVLVALIGAGGAGKYGGAGAGLVAMIPGIGIAVAGFIMLAFVQMGRAQVDTAEYTQQMLKIARDQLEVSRQAVNGGKPMSKSFSSLSSDRLTQNQSRQKSKLPNTPNDPQVALGLADGTLEVMGETITVTNGKFLFDDKSFNLLKEARLYIENSYLD